MKITERTVNKRYRTLSDVWHKGRLYPAGTIIEDLPWADASKIGVGWQIEPAPLAAPSHTVVDAELVGEPEAVRFDPRERDAT